MSSPEMQLISRIVRSGSLKDVLEWGITQDDFLTGAAKGYFKRIRETYEATISRGSVHGVNSWALQFPSFPYCDDASVTTNYLCSAVRTQRIRLESKNLGLKFVEELEEGDPTAALARMNRFSSELISLGASKNATLSGGEAARRLRTEYLAMKAGVDKSILAWPWDPLQEETGGIQPDDYAIIYGRPKSMKSWVMAYLMAWAVDHDKRVLIYTKEMTADNIYKRIYGCIGRLPYRGVRLGKLVGDDDERYSILLDYREEVDADNRLHVLLTDSVAAGQDTVPWLHAQVERLQPDIVFVDGLYLLSDDSSKKATRDDVRVMNISRGLREMVLHTGRPVIATVQANRKAAGHSEGNLDEIAFSDAIAQDATLAIRSIYEKRHDTAALVVAGSREFKLDGFRINAVPAIDFTFHSVMDEKEVEKAKEKDSTAAAAKKTAAKKKNGAPPPPPAGDEVNINSLVTMVA